MMCKNRNVLWQDHTSPELGDLARAGAAVIVPVGSIEQHGPHLPVSTDITSAFEVASRSAEKIDEFPVLVAPPVWWGVSPHHMGFPGTITLSTDTFIALVCDVCRSIAAHGFRRILILNGHGGNAALVSVIAQKLSEGPKPLWVAAASYFLMIAEDLKAIGESPLGGICHACEMETSLLLTLCPNLVHTDRAIDEMRKPLTSFFESDLRAVTTVYYPDDLMRDSRHGVLGVPSLATAEKGARILQAAEDKVIRFIREFQTMSAGSRSPS
jgi:creatinine amidohydrolase